MKTQSFSSNNQQYAEIYKPSEEGLRLSSKSQSPDKQRNMESNIQNNIIVQNLNNMLNISNSNQNIASMNMQHQNKFPQ